MPPSMFKTILVKRKVHRSSRVQAAESSRRSNSSPMGIPHPARKTS
jgi:hypothetical protein